MTRCYRENDGGREAASVEAVSFTSENADAAGSGSFSDTTKRTEEFLSDATAGAAAMYNVLPSEVLFSSDATPDVPPLDVEPERSRSTFCSSSPALSDSYASARSSNTPVSPEASVTCQVRFQPAKTPDGRSSSRSAPSARPAASEPSVRCSICDERSSNDGSSEAIREAGGSVAGAVPAGVSVNVGASLAEPEEPAQPANNHTVQSRETSRETRRFTLRHRVAIRPESNEAESYTVNASRAHASAGTSRNNGASGGRSRPSEGMSLNDGVVRRGRSLRNNPGTSATSRNIASTALRR